MAQNSRIIRSIFTHPLSWSVLAVAAGLEWAFFAWFQPPPTMAAAALGLGALCLALWPVLFVRSEVFARALYGWTDDLKTQQEEKLRTLELDFEELAFAQGATQLRMLRDKTNNLAEVLKRRLNAGELTYGRYLAMAEQVYLAALDNLHEMAVALRSVSTIDPEYIESRIRELRDGEAPSGEHEREFTALSNRGVMFAEQQQRVAELIAQNEAAMTVLDQTATALAGTRTAKGHASMDAESAMTELENLAKRVGKYATTR